MKQTCTQELCAVGAQQRHQVALQLLLHARAPQPPPADEERRVAHVPMGHSNTYTLQYEACNIRIINYEACTIRIINSDVVYQVTKLCMPVRST